MKHVSRMFAKYVLRKHVPKLRIRSILGMHSENMLTKIFCTSSTVDLESRHEACYVLKERCQRRDHAVNVQVSVVSSNCLSKLLRSLPCLLARVGSTHKGAGHVSVKNFSIDSPYSRMEKVTAKFLR